MYFIGPIEIDITDACIIPCEVEDEFLEAASKELHVPGTSRSRLSPYLDDS